MSDLFPVQAFALSDGLLRCEVAVNVTRCLLGIAHCMGGFPSAELFGIGVVVGQGTLCVPACVCVSVCACVCRE